MTAKKILPLLVVLVILAATFASAGSASAWSGCASYVTVQWGDTLSGIAMACGTTMQAIQAANPGLGWWLYPGQVLYIPTGYTSTPAYYSTPAVSGTYVVQWGDTLGDIAVRYGVSLSNLLAVNPQIWNASLIFPGQVINLPAYASVQPSTYYPCNCYPSTYYPTPVYSSQYSVLKVTYGHGLLVRSGPGKSYSEIKSPLVSAVKNTTWWYRKNSVTVDSTGYVWVEVTLDQAVNGYSTGWIMVKDSLGNYFTDPSIDPKIDP
jgi:LysM repeat protein